MEGNGTIGPLRVSVPLRSPDPHHDSVVRRALALVALVLAIQAGPFGASATSSAATPSSASARAAAAPVGSTLPRAVVRNATGRAPKACAAGLVALTFDDGPARGVTRRLLRTLVDRHVPATFFMVGSRVQSSPRSARRVARAGFTIGNHTWSHRELTRLSDRAIRRELRRTARELRRDHITPSTLMRPPYGAIDARVRRDVHDLRLVPVLWNVDSNDWRGGSTRQIADSILGQLQRHRDNIVLQHDGVRNSPASIAAVPRVVREARRRGYCFGSLDPRGHIVAPTPAASQQAPTPTTSATSSAPAAPGRAVVRTPFGAVLDRTAAA
jgi:peptidoglycan/xylan/chitin deacetylase (PgdA/CDA1 family)